jgi:hypothetical protein
VDDADVADLRRVLKRRTESLAILIALDGPALRDAEVTSALAEVHGLLKSAARLAGIGAVAIPSSDDREPAEL